MTTKPISKRTFYMTEVKVTVLSEKPLPDPIDLEDLQYRITEGECSGQVKQGDSVPIPATLAAGMLMEQGSDPEFFGLDENGCDKEG